jgi:hypothetical protein
MLFLALWAYRTSAMTDTRFTPFQLVYGMETDLPIECAIPSLKLVVSLFPDTSAESELLLYLTQLNEHCCEATLLHTGNNKNQVKA